MIQWIYGDSGMGKTTLAQTIARQQSNTIYLTGEEMREVWTDLTWSDKDRDEQKRRLARLALTLSFQGFNVVVTTMPPNKAMRKEISGICGCRFIEIKGVTWREPWKE